MGDGTEFVVGSQQLKGRVRSTVGSDDSLSAVDSENPYNIPGVNSKKLGKVTF